MIIVLYALSDGLLDLLMEFLHLSFEAIEFTLDVIIEHLFETDRHATQTITFYMLLLIAAYGCYRLGRKLADGYRAGKTALADSRHRITLAAAAYWHTTPTMRLLKGWSVLTIGVSILLWSLFA